MMNRSLPLLLLLPLVACGDQGESPSELAIREGARLALVLRRLDPQEAQAQTQAILECCDEPVSSLVATHLDTRRKLADKEGWRTTQLTHRPIRAIPDGEADWRLFVPIDHELVNNQDDPRLDREMVVVRLHGLTIEDQTTQYRLLGVEVVTRERWLALGMPEAWDDQSPVPW
jgi:hypothetical protein